MVTEDNIFQGDSRHICDMALVGDNPYSAKNSNPFSLGLVLSKGAFPTDSLVFYSSSNGGMSFDSHYNIVSTQKYSSKSALLMGKVPQIATGRYL